MSELPIDVVASASPLTFRWRQWVEGMDGRRAVPCEGQLPASCEAAVAELVERAKAAESSCQHYVADLAAAQADRDKLQAFKDWVHAYLDAKGVPKEIDGPHSREGCRVGDRMDWLVKALWASSAEDALKAQIAALEESLAAANRRANAAEVLVGNQRQMLDELRGGAEDAGAPDSQPPVAAPPAPPQRRRR